METFVKTKEAMPTTEFFPLPPLLISEKKKVRAGARCCVVSGRKKSQNLRDTGTGVYRPVSQGFQDALPSRAFQKRSVIFCYVLFLLGEFHAWLVPAVFRATSKQIPSEFRVPGKFRASTPNSYHCGRKRCIINSETFSTCSQHVNFTFINSQEFHASCMYLLHARSHVGYDALGPAKTYILRGTPRTCAIKTWGL